MDENDNQDVLSFSDATTPTLSDISDISDDDNVIVVEGVPPRHVMLSGFGRIIDALHPGRHTGDDDDDNGDNGEPILYCEKPESGAPPVCGFRELVDALPDAASASPAVALGAMGAALGSAELRDQQ